MTIEINPETERVLRQEIHNGTFSSIDDLILAGVQAWKEKMLGCAPADEADNEARAVARREAGEAIRELRKGTTLDRPEGMSIRDYAHLGHKY